MPTPIHSPSARPHLRLFLLSILIAPIAFAAELPLLYLKESGDGPKSNVWQGAVKYLPGSDEQTPETYELDTKVQITRRELIPINRNKTYRLSGAFRSASQNPPASAYFGVIMYDADKKMITMQQVGVFPETDLTLPKNVHERDTRILLPLSQKWLDTPYKAIAFHAKSDLSDLPNFRISPRVIALEAMDENFMEAVLQKPLDAAYPAGTNLRLHIPWATPLYWIADEWVPTEWKTYSQNISGEAPSGTPTDQFWKGTRYVRVLVQLGNWNRVPEEGARLLFKDISFSEISP